MGRGTEILDALWRQVLVARSNGRRPIRVDLTDQDFTHITRDPSLPANVFEAAERGQRIFGLPCRIKPTGRPEVVTIDPARD